MRQNEQGSGYNQFQGGNFGANSANQFSGNGYK